MNEQPKSLYHHLQELQSGGCMNRRMRFRLVIQKEYTSKTLTVEIPLEGKAVTRTEIYATRHERYSLTRPSPTDNAPQIFILKAIHPAVRQRSLHVCH